MWLAYGTRCINKLKQWSKLKCPIVLSTQASALKCSDLKKKSINMELRVGVQHYEWGKIGSNSEVARLFCSGQDDVVIDEALPYAELWMGTHKNCPSEIKSTGMELACVIQNHPEYLGERSVEKFGRSLPFLFKVLSINKALSIQAHPNKQHAELLHAQRPEIYKDPNHKPELAIALTDFKAMCGFRPFAEIQNNFKAVPELQPIIGAETYNNFMGIRDASTAEKILPQCFRNLMNCSDEVVTEAVTTMVKRIKTTKANKTQNDINQLILKLNDEFPNDVGCFGPLFFNVLNLKPGDALFLGANEPHAYLQGDCIECMACSDNVVRAGLTPKLKDVETLCGMLNYAGAPAKEKLFQSTEENQYTKVFRPPVPDFAVAMTQLPKGETTKLPVRSVASIVLFVKGYAHTQDDVVCSVGTILFIPAKTEVQLVDVKENVVCYQGMANLS